MNMLYVVALTVSCVIILAGFVYVWHTQDVVHAKFEKVRQQLLEKRAAGEFDPEWDGVDVERLQPHDINLKMPRRDATRVDFARFLAVYWPVLVPIVVGVCFVAAWMFGRWWAGS